MESIDPIETYFTESSSDSELSDCSIYNDSEESNDSIISETEENELWAGIEDPDWIPV